MTADQWKTIEPLFHAAMELSPAARPAFLASACTDPEIRAAVERLLAYSTEDEFLEAGAFDPARSAILSAADGPSARGEDASGPMPGTLLAERYRIVRVIGRGGHSVVYLAADQRIADRPVVVKILQERGEQREQFQKRFRREIEILGKVHHPTVVAAHDCGELSTGQLFLVMDYVDGITLRERLHSPIGNGEIAEIARQIGSALDATHDLGIIHRDLKPENIMFARLADPAAISVKLIDFGIARIDRPGVTTTNLLVAGTTRYMAPEQFFGVATTATDIFALGVIFHEMLTGSTPFEPADLARAFADRRSSCPIRDLDRLPRAARPAIRAMLSLAPEQRPQRAGRATAALYDALLGKPNRKTLAVLTGTASLTLLCAAWLFLHSPKSLEPSALRLSPPTRITADSELAMDPALSTDGSRIAYASDRAGEGHTDIWLHAVATGKTLRLTHDDAGADQPAFSPNGSLLAYHSRSGGIYTMPAAGGNPLRVIEQGEHPRFSPDGTYIAFLTGTTEGGDGVARIVPLQGGRSTAMSRNCGAGYPIWSSDGKHLLVWCKLGAGAYETADFQVIPTDGGEAVSTGISEMLSAQRLQPPTSPMTYFSAEAWVGHQVIFAARKGADTALWSIPVSEHTGKALGPATIVDTHGAHGLFAGSVSVGVTGPALLAFATLDANTDLYRLPMRADGSAALSAPQRLTTNPGLDYHPSLAADGRSLAFVSDRSGRRSVWHKDLVTGVETQLTRDQEVKLAPRISPDGSRVVFTTEKDRRRSVWQVPVGTLLVAPAKVCDDCGYPYGWSPDGRRVLMDKNYDGVTNNPWFTLFFRDLSSGQESGASTGHYWLDLKISSDGKWAAVSSYVSADSLKVFIARLKNPGSGNPLIAPPEEWITVSDTPGQKPAWGADGTIVYFLSNRDGHVCVWARRVNPRTMQVLGDVFPVLHSHLPALSLENLGVDSGIDLQSGPGELIFAQKQRRGSIWLASVIH